MSENEITLADFEERYKALRAKNPKIKSCSVPGCKNPRDEIGYYGTSTTCAYHRLLFDHWLYEVIGPKIATMSQKGRRRAFTNWRNRIGKENCDAIVLELAQDAINWYC